MKFPVCITSNFFENPDEVRDFALSLDFPSKNPVYPGSRTLELDMINPALKDRLMYKVLTQFTDSENIEAVGDAYFQKIRPSDTRGTDGAAHRDNAILTAMVYLTPNVQDCGTSILRPKTDLIKPFNAERKMHFYSGGEDEGFADYVKEFNEYHYEEVARSSGAYNTMISFNGFEAHRANLTPVSEDDNIERLTMILFITEIYGMYDTEYKMKKVQGV
jgi:hypothetical protein